MDQQPARPAPRARPARPAARPGSSEPVTGQTSPKPRRRPAKPEARGEPAVGKPHAGEEMRTRARAEEGDKGAGDESEERQAKAPWHFKFIIVGSIVYLGWRLYQGISWLAHHL